MINIEKECWINVFASGTVGCPLGHIDAVIETINMNKIFKDKTVYRIHVKLKPEYWHTSKCKAIFGGRRK